MPEPYYPRADTTTQRFDDNYPGSRFTYPLKRVVWHTTETSAWPTYDGGAKAPTLTARPDMTAKTLTWRQHFPVDMAARALRNLSGGVETNRDECVQVEIVGTCDPTRHASSPSWLYTPEAPEWVLAGMADFSAWCLSEWGIPLTDMPVWQAYPASYGGTANRMTNSAWSAFRGHCGHQHVPENVHGDPGKMAIRSMLLAADAVAHPAVTTSTSLTDTLEEDDMFICHSDDGRQFLVHGLAKTYIPTMAIVTELKACGVKDQGSRSAGLLGLFPTVDVGDVGNFYQFGAERQVEMLTALGDLQTTVEDIEVLVEGLATPPPAAP
jgi:hypothetical protein